MRSPELCRCLAEIHKQVERLGTDNDTNIMVRKRVISILEYLLMWQLKKICLSDVLEAYYKEFDKR